MTLFPNWLEHFTDSYEGSEERVTLAFDIITEVVYNEDVFNKDRFCRSFYTYIEDASNELSQLNSGNSYYVESLAF